MLIPSRAWGFIRVGGNGQFGPLPSQLGTGGTDANPAANDVDAGDEAAGTQFVCVFSAQEASGDLRVRWDNGLSFVGAADGSYSIPYDLYTFTPGDSAAVEEGSTTFDVTVGGGGASLNIDADAVTLSGSIAVSGDIQITEAPELDIDAAPVALVGSVSASGDIQIGTSFDLEAAPVAMAGAMAVSGDIESSVDPVLDIEADAVALAGAVGVSGDIEIGRSSDLASDPVALAGTVGVSGDIEVGTSFDLDASPVALSGSMAASGDIAASTAPIAPPATPGSGAGGGSAMSFERWRRSLDDDIEDMAERRVREEDEMVLDCITALVAAGVL